MSATMKDTAKETGLGLATISSYFNGGNVREKNRIKIEEAIEKLHFEVNEVARGLKTNRTKIIGIVIPELNNIFCAEIITEVEDILRGHGYASIICDCRTDEKREEEAIDFLKKKRVDGMIIMPSGNKGDSLKKILKSQIPLVMIDRKIKGIDCDCVLVDNLKAAEDAIMRLIEAGHKKIGMIAGPKDVFTAEERLKGYYLAIEKAGLEIRDSLVVNSNYTISGGAEALRRLVEANADMTAVFVSNYEMTMGAIIEANELNVRIPEQLSFIGFDNVEFARACIPKLSIVTQPTREIAKSVSSLILQRLGTDSKEKKQTVIKLETSFIEGKSVAKKYNI